MEILPGVQRVGKIIIPAEDSAILVHPWFEIEKNKFPLWSGSGDYINNLDNFLKKSKGKRNLFLFEQERDIQGSIESLSHLFGNDGLYVIETFPCDSTPKNLDAYNLLRGFGGYFVLGGGEVRKEGDSYDGCLGGLHGQLNKRGMSSSFLEGCCFTKPN